MRALSAVDVREVAECRARGEHFWLDVTGTGPAVLNGLDQALGMSADVFRSLTEFGQPPRVASHGNRAVLVFYGARVRDDGDPEPVEVHLLSAPGELVTVHDLPIPALAALHEGPALGSDLAAGQVLARLGDSLVDVLEAIEDEVDELEDAIIERPTDAQLRRLTDLRHALAALRRTTTPQRDLVLREAERLAALPGLSGEALREVQARLVLARDMVDSARELVTGALDLYQSTVSTRLNRTGQRLGVIATLALPLAVLTGFFGQNFGWLVGEIDTLVAFLLLGIGSPLLVIGGLLYALRRGGYL